jgi:hypothetical protein
MCDKLESIIYYIVDSFFIRRRYVMYVMVTYYVTQFTSLFINYLPRHYFCLVGLHITT